MKTCFKCGIEKPLSEFYAHPQMGDGHLNKCKQCTCRDTKKRTDKLSKTNLEWVLKERERCRMKGRRFFESGGRWERFPETLKKYRAKYPEKTKAHNAVSNAIREGKMKSEPCFCGAKAHAHHDDYSKPLDVIWLCPKHHSEHHVKLREQELIAKFQSK